MKYNKSFYEKYGLKITDDAVKTPENAPILSTLQRLHNDIRHTSNISSKTIAELEHYMAQYPEVSTLKNYLYLAYSKSNQKQKAIDILHLTVEQHPDYIFGQINLAGHYMSEKLLNEAAAVLKEPYDISNLGTEEFIHESVLKSYYGTAISLELRRKNKEKAEKLHRILYDYDKDDEEIKNLARQIMLLRLEKTPLLRKAPNERKVVVIPKPIKSNFLTVNGQPIFKHPEIHQLYKYSLKNIPKSVVQSILALPRPTLIADLEHAFLDVVVRYKYFRELDWDDDTCNFFVHALYLLTEHRSYRSLPVILDFLRQDEGFREFWVADWLETYFKAPLYILGENQLGVLKDFALEENVSPWHRVLANGVAAQVAIKQPNRREEIIQWFRAVIDHHLENPNNHNLIDSNFLSSLITDLINFSAIELEEDIKKLFATGWIQDSFCGNLDEVLKDLHKPFDPYRNDPLPTDIYDLYSADYEKRRDKTQVEHDPELIAKLNDPYQTYLMHTMFEGLMKNKKEEEEEDYYDEDDDDRYYQPQPTIKREEPKVGRNDPCPCGSGKKFKKCHGK
jgi:hypothetical protein